MDRDHEDYAAAATLTYYAGLRIHECFRLNTAAARTYREKRPDVTDIYLASVKQKGDGHET